MPRTPRVDAPGAIHHVTFRGIERREIFADDADREALLARFDRVSRTSHFRVFAWTLMPNHAHLVLQTELGGLSRLMARVETSYALYFNRRHGRVGHVFQNRFWSRPLDEDLEVVVAYVHHNPVRAGLVAADALANYPWCGYGARVGARPPREFERNGWTPPGPHGRPRLARIVAQECLRARVPRNAIVGANRMRAVASARRAIVLRAFREMGCAPREIARMLGITRWTVLQILRRAGEPDLHDQSRPTTSPAFRRVRPTTSPVSPPRA
jgi:REP element-mobilizing transposase RayT